MRRSASAKRLFYNASQLSMTAVSFNCPFLFFLLFFLVFVKDELWGLVALLCCFILFDRNFAYVHLQLGTYPLYITEYVILIWSFKVMLKPTRVMTAFAHWPKMFQLAWCLFLVAGIISILRGIGTYPTVQVFRDS